MAQKKFTMDAGFVSKGDSDVEGTLNAINVTINNSPLSTKDYVDSQIVNVNTGGTVTLDGYVTEGELTTALVPFATDADIQTAIDNMVGAAPPELNTIAELANAIGNDSQFATNVNAALDTKADYSQLINYATTLSLNTAVSVKADMTYVDSKLTYDSLSTLSSSAGAVTLDTSVARVFSLTLTENVTSMNFTNAVAGRAYSISLRIEQGSSHSVTWPSNVKWSNSFAPEVTLEPGTVDWYVFVTVDGGATWDGFQSAQAMGVPF